MTRLRKSFCAVLSCLSALSALSAAVAAAELQPPILLKATDMTPNPAVGAHCAGLPPPGRIVAGRLILRNTDRPDVGPYTVTLPGYATDLASSARDSYRPLLVLASPGDTMRFDVVDQLDPSSSLGGIVNLHTHGLIVSPRSCPPLGDYALAMDEPGTTTFYRIDIPVTLPGHMFGKSPVPQPYPSGLNWFHAHIHGDAVNDVFSGQTGMLYIGDVRDDLMRTRGASPASVDALKRTDIVYLGLRDIQLAVPPGKTPDHAAAGTRAQFLAGDGYESDACVPENHPVFGRGYCSHPNNDVYPGRDTVWLFTINGQRDPDITMMPGRNQLWRIVNLSPSLTYRLELVDDRTQAVQPLNVLTIDGIIAGHSAPGEPSTHVGVKLSSLLLMPASRAEIFVPSRMRPGPGRLTLRTAGITTGASGDPWPRIDLAHVVPAPDGPDAPGASVASNVPNGPNVPNVPNVPNGPNVLNMPNMPNASNLRSTVLAQPGAGDDLDVTMPKPLDAAGPSVSPAASFKAQATQATQATQAPVNCVTLPAGGPPTRRRITFTNNDAGTDFELGSEVVDARGVPVDVQHTIAPAAFSHADMVSPGSVRHVCPRLGEAEVWELVNKTTELHNFHIHQSKFRLSRPGDRGVPPRLQAIQDPTGIIAQYQPESLGATPQAHVDAWHDVLPVPPSDGNGHDGHVFVTIPFYAQEQVGTSVFHCHILEHEDGGMMALVQVIDPKQ